MGSGPLGVSILRRKLSLLSLSDGNTLYSLCGTNWILRYNEDRLIYIEIRICERDAMKLESIYKLGLYSN